MPARLTRVLRQDAGALDSLKPGYRVSPRGKRAGPSLALFKEPRIPDAICASFENSRFDRAFDGQRGRLVVQVGADQELPAQRAGLGRLDLHAENLRHVLALGNLDLDAVALPVDRDDL